MSHLELIGGAASNYVWACRILLAEKNIAYTHTPAMPHTPEVTAIHPLGKIPVLRHGEVALCESRAIYQYIERTFDGPSLMPADAVGAAKTDQWISIVNTAIDPLWVRTYLRENVFPTGPNGTANRDAIAGALPRMKPHFDMMDRAVEAGHLVGGRFTLADINFIPILYYMSGTPEAAEMLAQSPNLAAYLRLHLERASVKSTLPPPLRPRTAQAA